MNLALLTSWRARDVPLGPAAVAATGPLAARLAEHLLRTRPSSEALARLHGVAAPDLLVLLGPDLPWIDGVTYLGADPQAPSLLLPTALEPPISPALLGRALASQQTRHITNPPLAVLLDPPRLVSLAAARPITPAHLRAFLNGDITIDHINSTSTVVKINIDIDNKGPS